MTEERRKAGWDAAFETTERHEMALSLALAENGYVDDDPDVQYRHIDTRPILASLRQRGYALASIPAEPEQADEDRCDDRYQHHPGAPWQRCTGPAFHDGGHISGLPEPEQADEVAGLPDRIVVGANGAYWRDFGTYYSMCVVSTDNDPVVPIAVYVRARLAPAPDGGEK